MAVYIVGHAVKANRYLSFGMQQAQLVVMKKAPKLTVEVLVAAAKVLHTNHESFNIADLFAYLRTTYPLTHRKPVREAVRLAIQQHWLEKAGRSGSMETYRLVDQAARVERERLYALAATLATQLGGTPQGALVVLTIAAAQALINKYRIKP